MIFMLVLVALQAVSGAYRRTGRHRRMTGVRWLGRRHRRGADRPGAGTHTRLVRRAPGRQPVQRRDRPGPARVADLAGRPAGRGSFGQLLRSRALAEGIDLAHSVDAPEPTTLAVVTLDPQARAQLRLLHRGHGRLAMDPGLARDCPRSRWSISGRWPRGCRPAMPSIRWRPSLRPRDHALVSLRPERAPVPVAASRDRPRSGRGRRARRRPGQGQPRGRRLALPGRVARRRRRAVARARRAAGRDHRRRRRRPRLGRGRLVAPARACRRGRRHGRGRATRSRPH